MNDGQRITIKPATKALVLRDPDTRQRIPEQGAEVVLTPYWRRRVDQGDAVIVELQAEVQVQPSPQIDVPARRTKGS